MWYTRDAEQQKLTLLFLTPLFKEKPALSMKQSTAFLVSVISLSCSHLQNESILSLTSSVPINYRTLYHQSTPFKSFSHYPFFFFCSSSLSCTFYYILKIFLFKCPLPRIQLFLFLVDLYRSQFHDFLFHSISQYKQKCN